MTGLLLHAAFHVRALFDELRRFLPFLRARPWKPRVFCILPWVHMNVAQEGRVYPCCMSHYSGQEAAGLGSLGSRTLKEIWNSEGLRRLRLSMLAGRESPECAGCYELEKSGFRSFRQKSNLNFSRHFPKTRATRPDGGLDAMSMPFMDIRFSNICNFRCRTCGPYSSSSWHEEGLRLPGFTPPERVLRPTRDPEDLWRQLEPLLPGLEEVYFAGGEPLVMEEHYRLLDFLIERRMFRVRLSYSTNFSTTAYQGKDVLRLWDRFETVHVGASLDAMGRRGEYLRKGQDWSRVVLDRERMFKDCPRVRFRLTPTLSAMNALHLPDFHEEWSEKGYIAVSGMDINVLLDPPEYRVQMLPAHLKRRVEERYAAYIEGGLRRRGIAAWPMIARFRAALDFLKAQDLPDALEGFRRRTRRLDGWRDEKFGEVFPELAELLAGEG